MFAALASHAHFRLDCCTYDKDGKGGASCDGTYYSLLYVITEFVPRVLQYIPVYTTRHASYARK